MSLERPFTPELVTALGAVRSAQFLRINAQANAALHQGGKGVLTLHGSRIEVMHAAQLVASAPELLDKLEVAKSTNVVHRAIGEASPFDRVVSLGEASELTLRIDDSLSGVEAPKTGASSDDLFVYHIQSSKHRDNSYKLFAALDVEALRDAEGALQRYVKVTLYLSNLDHCTPNKVPPDLMVEIRGLVTRSAVLGTVAGVSFLDDANTHTLAGELARAVLSAS